MRYASGEARLKCATYPRSQYMVLWAVDTQYMIMWAVDRLKRRVRVAGQIFFGSIDR